MREIAPKRRPRPSGKAQRQRDEGSHGDSFVGKDRTTSPVSAKQAGGFLSTIQPKLTINQPGDIYEQEADQVADQVMRTPSPSQQGEIKNIQAKEGPGETPAAVSPIASASGGGQTLPESTRAFFESRLGQDLSQVRVHTDKKAAESAQAVNALAYTMGRDVVFGAGQYAPGSAQGKRLLAHELTHITQQNQRHARNAIQRAPDPTAAACTSLTLDELKKKIKSNVDTKAIPELFINLKTVRTCFPAFTETDFLDLVRGGKAFTEEELKNIWAESKKPFAGYTASGFEAANRFINTRNKKALGYELAAGHKKAAELTGMPSAEVLKIYSQADVLFFSGHQYAQYKAPGVWTTAGNAGFDVRKLNSPMTKVKLLISTSCATICKEAAEAFKPLFPNATILGFKKSAPLEGGKLANAFADKLPEDLLLGPGMSGVSEAKRAWKAVAEKIHAGSSSQPGWLDLSSDDMEFWDGKKWISGKGSDAANKCFVKGDYSADWPAPAPAPAPAVAP